MPQSGLTPYHIFGPGHSTSWFDFPTPNGRFYARIEKMEIVQTFLGIHESINNYQLYPFRDVCGEWMLISVPMSYRRNFERVSINLCCAVCMADFKETNLVGNWWRCGCGLFSMCGGALEGDTKIGYVLTKWGSDSENEFYEKTTDIIVEAQRLLNNKDAVEYHYRWKTCGDLASGYVFADWLGENNFPHNEKAVREYLFRFEQKLSALRERRSRKFQPKPFRE